MKRTNRRPILGESFNPEQMNMGEVFAEIAHELAWYLPDVPWRIQSDLKIASDAYERSGTEQAGHDALNEAECLLTEWAQSVEKHDYIYYTVSGDFAGFRINVDTAIEDADWRYECNGWRTIGTPHKPGDGAGLEIFVNDHGNVTAWRYGRNGHKRELFSVV
jgi:hypothetical protein